MSHPPSILPGMDFADRYVTLAEPLAAFDSATIEVGALLVASDPYAGAQVPLRDWSFNQLRQHLITLLDEYASLAEGDPSQALPDRGDDYSAAFLEAKMRIRDAFSRPGYLGERAPTPLGLQPGSVVAQHVVNELVSHSWDLARSMDRRNRYPDWLPDRCRLSWQVIFEEFGRPQVNFDPEQPAPPTASPTDRLAAYLGRRV